MDAFLRRVFEQRLLEQEADIVAISPEQLVRRCRVCNRQMGGDSISKGRVCLQCGGLKLDLVLKRRDELLRLAGLRPLTRTTGAVMPDRNCSKCGTKLHWKNKGDECPACRPGAEESGGGLCVAAA